MRREAPAARLRPAAQVMSPERAGAAVPNALAFSRSALRELQRGGWRIEKLRFDLDAEGRGEILYRVADGRWTFHFFLVSLKLDEAMKMDRNWAQSWDAMGVLCQGEWSAEREALLRAEVPKQRGGYADYGTLVYARGNRSARLFDHVVESLAAGRQPDLSMIARVGYILRTTAFIANGQLGTRAYAGLEPDHPLRRPYHVQMFSAFLLREFVYDLVDHIARARNPRAARLDPAFRRFLGLGNAAATGLVSFIVNHPRLVERWTQARESAFAEAAARPAREGDAAALAYRRLLAKAIRHSREGERDSGDLFDTSRALGDDLERLGGVPVESWPALIAWAERNLGMEAQEALHAIVLELYPEIVAAAANAFHADERLEVRPEMTAAALGRLLQAQFGWAFEQPFGEASERYFWFRATHAPRENRRGRRGLAPRFEAENGMETVARLRELRAVLARTGANETVAEVLCRVPGLRHIVARVQGLAGMDYAELRANWLAKDFSPFEPVRFVLAFYGMERFEAALPKSVRGSFLQGAPIAEDLASGADGDWPYPLIPEPGSHPVGLAPLPPAGLGAVRDAPAPPVRDRLAVAPNELARTVQTALQAHGAPLGVAEEGGAIVAFAQGLGEPALAATLAQCSAGTLAPNGAAMTPEREDGAWRLDARGASALLAAPAALDLACGGAIRDGTGVALVANVAGADMLGQLALRCAERGLMGAVAWSDGARIGMAMAGPGEGGPWYASTPPAAALGEFGEALVSFVSQGSGRFGVACRKMSSAPAPQFAWNPEALRERRTAWQQQGITIGMAQLQALERAAAALLVPAAEVPALRPNEESDPLKVF